jgi:hypothetical protein
MSPHEFISKTFHQTLPYLILEFPSAINGIVSKLNLAVEKILLPHVHSILAKILLCTEQLKRSSGFSTLRDFLKFEYSKIFNFRKMDLVMLLVEKLGTVEPSRLSSIQNALRFVATVTEQSYVEKENRSDEPHSQGRSKTTETGHSSRKRESPKKEKGNSQKKPLSRTSSGIPVVLVSDDTFRDILAKWMLWILDRIFLFDHAQPGKIGSHINVFLFYFYFYLQNLTLTSLTFFLLFRV